MDEHRRRGNVLVTPAVQMTAAASGSSGIVVADSAEYDFGTVDFTVFWEGDFFDFDAGVHLLSKDGSGGGQGVVELLCLGTGVLRLSVAGSLATTDNVASTDAVTSPRGFFAATYEHGSPNDTVRFYWQGAKLGADVATVAKGDISSTAALHVSGRATPGIRELSDTIRAGVLNFKLSDAQVAQLYSSGIPAEWMWGDNSDVYGLLPGSSTAFYSSPDSAASSVTGDIEIIVRAALDLPTSDQCFISKYSSSPTPQRSYIFRVVSGGFLQLALSPDGSADVITNSSAAHGFSAGAVAWFRATWSDSSDAVNFYTSTTDTEDPSLVSWTLLGDADRPLVSAGIYEGTAPVAVGIFDGNSNAFDGKIYRAQVYSGIGGTLAVDFNPRDYGHNTTFVSKQTGETWTLNGAATIEGIGATLALLPDTLPTSGALEWPDSANGNDGTLPAAGATKVVIRR